VTLLEESLLPEGTSTLLTSSVAESIAREALAQHVDGIESSRIEQVEGSQATTYDIVDVWLFGPELAVFLRDKERAHAEFLLRKDQSADRRIVGGSNAYAVSRIMSESCDWQRYEL
jgi:hypothetical protein